MFAVWINEQMPFFSRQLLIHVRVCIGVIIIRVGCIVRKNVVLLFVVYVIDCLFSEPRAQQQPTNLQHSNHCTEA